MPLEPYQNLDMIIQRANAAYLYSRHRGCPEERLMLLRNLIDNATAQKAALMAPPPMPGGMPGAPGPMPGPQMGAMPGPQGPSDNTQMVNVQNNMPNMPVVPPVVA